MSRTPVLALTSDWHAQPGAWARANTPRGDSFYALRQFYYYCRENGVDLVGAGDLHDELRPDSATMRGLFSFVDDMDRAGRRIYYTTGQHDKALPPFLSLHPKTVHINRRAEHPRGVAVYGFDHVPAGELEAEIAKVPSGADVVVCHQVWTEFMGVGTEGSLAALGGKAPVVLTGDYHDHGSVTVGGGTTAYSPGSTCLQDVAEPRGKAFFVLYDDLSVESVPLRTRQVFDFTVLTPEDLDEFVRLAGVFCEPQPKVPPEIEKNIIYVQYGDVDQAFKRIARAVGDRAFLFTKSVALPPDVSLVDNAEVAARVAGGLEGCLGTVTPEGGAVYNSTLRLLRAADKKAELAAMAVDFGR